jgi:hypothetical protein
MKNLFVMLTLVLSLSCNNAKTPPEKDESRGYYPEENVDESAVKAVSPENNKDSTKSAADSLASRHSEDKQ